MVRERQFSDIPLHVIPRENEENLAVLLAEDVILRRDPANDPTHLGPPQDVLNFTYDEFRDFLIAKYLVQNLYEVDRSAFLEFMSLGETIPARVTEGIKRFLFYWARLPQNAAFRKFYAAQTAYGEVYPAEIFSIAEAHTEEEDAIRVRAILGTRDETATFVADCLIDRWDSRRYPFLNLELLIDVVGQGDDAHYDILIRKNFVTDYFKFERQSPTRAYCEDIRIRILPILEPEFHQVLFDFLPMLFALEGEGELDSPSVRAFRLFSGVAPIACISSLLRSLDYVFTRHRPFVWRLLTEQSAALPDPRATRERACIELVKATPLTAREIRRFLARKTYSNP